jgi:hypothetical protein
MHSGAGVGGWKGENVLNAGNYEITIVVSNNLINTQISNLRDSTVALS